MTWVHDCDKPSTIDILGLCIAVILVLNGCTYGAPTHQISGRATIDEYPIKTLFAPRGIVVVGQTIWVASSRGILKVAPDGSAQLYAAGANLAVLPQGITYGPAHELWVTEMASYPQMGHHDVIVAVSPNGVVRHVYQVPTYKAGVGAITTGSDQALWFVERQVGMIGRLALNGQFSQYAIGGRHSITRKRPGSIGLEGITGGSDGSIWFTELLADRIGRLDKNREVSEFQLPEGAGPEQITIGRHHDIWFTEYNAGKIGRMTSNGRISEIPQDAGNPLAITVGHDGSTWFTEMSSNKVARLTPKQTVDSYTIPGRAPMLIAALRNGDIWFVEGEASSTGAGDWGAVCRLSFRKIPKTKT